LQSDILAAPKTEYIRAPNLIRLEFMVRSITSSFHDAKLCDALTGNPNDDARFAYRWIMEQPVSRYQTGYGTFATYCHWLGWDYRIVRQIGTPEGTLGWKETIGGVAAIRHAWRRSKFDWYISGGPFRYAAFKAFQGKEFTDDD
jgi:hypothetical protein